MERVAFYAPMKPPTHPVPSGDREMARALLLALGGDGPVELVSDLRIYDGKGDAARQADLQSQATREAMRLCERLAGGAVTAWVTYHNYYKAPDLVGPPVCRALGLPYVLVESSRARKRLTGDWAAFARAAADACDAADAVCFLTEHAREALERDRPARQALIHLRPFLPLAKLPPPVPRPDEAPMLAAGMMRPGDKLASYRLLAGALALLDHPGWRLEIAGDGPARAEVEALVAPFQGRVTFLGQLDAAGLDAAYARAGLFLWPGVNEAYGMVYLEAQAHGLPVVAQDRPGLRDVLLPGNYPAPADGAKALAAEVLRLLDSADERQALGRRVRSHIGQHHLRPAARDTLWSALRPLLERNA